MDFSRLHIYTPPQCVPENTGYTYALSSSYSSDALDFETEHRLDPVFDSPRMSRRSLRLAATACGPEGGQAGDTASCLSGMASLKDRTARTAKQHRSASKLAFSVNRPSRQVAAGQSGGLQGAACLRPPVLDESLIREQTKVDHFWGLDDDGDLKGGNKAVVQGNGKVAADAAWSNGYTCRACTLLSEHQDTLPAHGASSRVYSRDRSQKPRSDPCGRRTVTEFLREDGDLSVNGESCHVSERALRRTGAAAWSVSQAVWSALWLAAAAPGKAASGIFWWLGSGWYQFVTLISWLNVFLLTRCLRNVCKFLIVLVPLLLFLGAGLSSRGQDGFLSLLPVFNWTHILRAQRVDDPKDMFTPDTSHLSQPPEGAAEASPWRWMSEVERQVTSLSGQCQSRDEKLRELTASLQKLQVRVDQMDDGGAGVSSLVTSVVGQHLKDLAAGGLLGSQADSGTFHHQQESRISDLEALLGKLAGKLEAIQKELEQTKRRTESSPGQEQHLPSAVAQLERDLEHLRSDMAAWQPLRSSCEEAHTVLGKVDAQVQETVRLLLSGDQQDGSLDWLLQKLSAQFVSKGDLQALLRELELQILKNITHHISVTRQEPTSEAIMAAVTSEGTSGITEAQARIIVNNALKLYSQDKTGMVDFALESGGGSILSTRCSETHETKTALISLFGIPLWYFSQSPRVVIQPDIYPGNCWAFKGSQGYLVVRLSMEIHPTSFTLEHIPKTLSPTGNIASAPKNFSVYGLENEYQEEGQLLGQFMFDQEGESLQTFPVPKRPERAFQIVELQIFSNWGHPEYTCLYRFRVHGVPVK
ncbi:SUN domain-containing protein 1 isoform X8 [Pipistrellus kuhlii]|uniref:Sad1 and UNC84 domain containing 1 n=1 Tax=Pipistrellus kuhlii TaxID=59472 RepID=A0A7J7QZF4_PIPKU|nr:SUN domain-containing protein 1 isoform X8 [Pipistrellus kuhlii]KAF6269288.1 Sad1 and UNC84 domain containing 1 [Pipistrellus kuhlii]